MIKTISKNGVATYHRLVVVDLEAAKTQGRSAGLNSIVDQLRSAGFCWVVDPENTLDETFRGKDPLPKAAAKSLGDLIQSAVLGAIVNSLHDAWEYEDQDGGGFSWSGVLNTEKKKVQEATFKVLKVTSPKTGKQGWKIEMI